MLASDLTLAHLDYTDPSLRGEGFHAAMAKVRADGWLATGPFGYVVLDHEAGEFFLRTRSATFPGLKIAELFSVPPGPLFDQIEHNLLNVGGDDHRRLRNLVNPALSPRAVERYRPAMREYLASLFASVSDAGRCEFVSAFARPYPSQVIATVMGAPLSDADRLHRWSNVIQRQFDAAALASSMDEISAAVSEFYAYASLLLEARRASPGDDLISALIAAEDAGDRLSGDECINLVFNVLVGGVDTTQSQLAHAVRLFAEHPSQWEALGRAAGSSSASGASLFGRAVEEVLRFEPITPFTARIMLEDVSFRGVTFPEGTVVLVCAFTGNRDGGRGAAREADRFDITAERGVSSGGRVLTFGAGVHYCLGANLARVELEEGLRFLAGAMPGLALDGEVEYGSILGVYGLEGLPVRWG